MARVSKFSAGLSGRWLARATSVCVLLGILGASGSHVQAQDAPEVPAPLRPWVGWAMHGVDDLDCPQTALSQSRVCVWPGALQVHADERGARFTLHVWLAARGDVRLVGDQTRWPQNVQVDGSPALVRVVDNRPIVKLDAGSHVVSGEFEWSALPEMLPVPGEVGQVSLRIGAAAVERPHLDDQGRLWLNAQGTGETRDAEGSLRTAIYRRISDGVPLQVRTEFSLNVSGRARKVDLGAVLLADSRPVSVVSELPVQLEPDGRVSIYVRPGTHTVTIDAVVDQDVRQLTVPTPGMDFFDPPEVWIWVPQEAVRSVELTGLQAVDPARTSLPAAWYGHSTYLAEPGAVLGLQVTRRGVEAAPNTVNLHRQIWLDVDGQGMSISDRITGTMARDWRLDYAGPAVLGHVQQIGESGGVLITTDADSGRRGVEVRRAKLDLQADLRLDTRATRMPAVGWHHDVQQLSADLYLPPGWTLLGASGVDQLSGSWLSTWTLWDFFFVLMVALSIGKLLGWRWVLLAALALVLSHGHEDAPMWVWIHLVATLALLRVLPDGWWRRGVFVWRAIAMMVLFGVLASFAHDQIRAAIHPQIDRDAMRVSAPSSFGSMGLSSMAPTADYSARVVEEVAYEAAEDSDNWKPDIPVLSRSSKMEKKSYAARVDLKQVDPKAVVQTGPGLPTWRWNQWALRWSGPVHKDHEMRLWLLTPSVNRALALGRVASLIVLALLLLLPAGARWQKPDDKGDEATRGASKSARKNFWHPLFHALMVLLAVGAAVAHPATAQAQSAPGKQEAFPEQTVLEELRNRMRAATICDGACLVVSRADFQVDGARVTMRAEVNAQKDAAWQLPGPAEILQVESVLVDGKPTRQLRRDADGMTLVRIPQGHHLVQMHALLAPADVVTVQLASNARPRFVTFAAAEWAVDGINPQGVPENSLQWTRLQPAETGEPAGSARNLALPPWYQVQRHIGLGLPWRVWTTVRRLDTSRPQMVNIPLIPGEKVMTEGLRIDQEQVLVNFERGADRVTYLSELPIQPAIELSAPEGRPWSETWTVQCSRIWHCEFSDLTPVALLADGSTQDETTGSDAAGESQPQWKPWPGERLSIRINRPEGADGQSSTVENVSYRVTPGQRLLEARLSLSIRASQGGWQQVTLPEGAQVRETRIDNEPRNLRLEGQKVNLPIRPGKAEYVVSWQQPWEHGLLERVPAVDIGSPAVNIEVMIERGAERWLLWTLGPAWGPAILFWAHLVTLLILAILLSRLRGLPLRSWEWILLLLGFSQLPLIAILPVIAWFVALRLHAHRPMQRWWTFNLTQLALIALTLAAAGTLYAAIHVNLLVNIDMQVRGADSSDYLLRWYVDRGGPALPTPGILSLPVLVWRLLMLGWSLWLVSRLLSWIPWAWRAFGTNGLWRPQPPRPQAPPNNARRPPQGAARRPPADAHPAAERPNTVPGVVQERVAPAAAPTETAPSSTEESSDTSNPPVPTGSGAGTDADKATDGRTESSEGDDAPKE